MINRERLLATFERLVSIDAETFQEREIKEYLRARLLELGLAVNEDRAAEALADRGATAGNLCARLAGTRAGEPLLFSAHMDTVSPGRGKRAVFHSDGRITSEGGTVLGADDAAGLAEILEALAVIRERKLPHPELEVVFPVAEEVYGRGSAALDYSAIHAKTAYILDLSGPIGTAAVRAPSILSLEITVKGRATHAGFSPELGVNALTIATNALSRLKTGHVSDNTTVNFGVISGGDGKNIVPAEVSILGEIRSLRHEEALAQGEIVEACFQAEAGRLGGGAEVRVIEELRAYSVGAEEPVVRRLRRALDELSYGEASLITTLGGSDNNNFAMHGIQGVVLACGMQEVHSTKEYTTVDDLCRGAELTLRLMTMEEDEDEGSAQIPDDRV